jgi:hypothetical protein
MEYKWTSIVLVALLVGAAAAETVEDKYPDGKIKRRYTVDAKGQKNGAYAEFHANGQVMLKATYKAGQLDGMLTHYENGRAVLKQTFREGRPVYARSLEQIKEKWAEMNAAAKGDGLAGERVAALARLKFYRYVVGVPVDNMVLDENLNKAAQAAAGICDKLGRLDHSPRNPGLPEAEYKLAYQGARNSNLAVGFRTIVQALDGWMFDSDANNIDRLGHRRWCLNPVLQKAGFGLAGRFEAMWAADRSRRAVPDFDFISYPANGLMPVEIFPAQAAWSVSLHPRKYRKPVKASIEVKLFAADEQLNRSGEPLKLNYFNVNTDPFGIPNCIIFRLEEGAVAAGRRFRVEITGIKRTSGQAATLRFVVEFVSLK